jgi:gliding motility-associated peptidyl-prolyl isomerase
VKDTLDHKTPVKGHLTRFTYEVKKLNDKVLFSKEEIGVVQYYVGKQEMISGLHDGIQLMKAGEKVIFLFPSYKAFGYSGNEKVNPNEPLKFTVELLKIN